MRLVVAMSGGVDSSVAAALLVEQGHEVIGVSMQLYPIGARWRRRRRDYGTCCTLDDLHDARRVAAAIGIPHYILNLESRFDDTVVSNFVREYVVGPHANPLRALQQRAEVRDAARSRRWLWTPRRSPPATTPASIEDEDGRFRLRRGRDPAKDQSYFLFSLTQAQMAQALFPIGELDKADGAAHARRLGLRVADKPDSQEICFVPDGDYAGVRRARGARPDARRRDRGRATAACSARTRACTASRSASARASACRPREPLYVLAHRAGDGAGDRRPQGRAGAHRGSTASRRELDVGQPAPVVAPRHRADPPPSRGRARAGPRPRRRARRARVRRAAGRGHAGAGGGVLRRRRGAGRRVD